MTLHPAQGYLLVRVLDTEEKLASGLYAPANTKKEISRIKVLDVGGAPSDQNGNKYSGYEDWISGVVLGCKKSSLIDLESSEKLSLVRYFDVLYRE